MSKKSSIVLRIYLVVSGILFLGICLYLSTDGKFLGGLLPKPEKKYPPIGMIESSSGDARVRSAGELLWVPSNAEDIIYDNDSVFTGPTGKMTIVLTPNTRLQVNKDSLFKVSRKNHLTTINLIQGDMDTTSIDKETIKIQHDEKSKTLKLTEVETKLSADALKALPAPVAVPNTLELTDALDDNADEIHTAANSEVTSPPESLPSNFNSENRPHFKEVQVLNQEGNRKIIWLLGIAYVVFSFIALKEIVGNKGSST